MSPRPKRITPHGSLEQAIKEVAWQQIAENGAPALSLRAIARELQITAPAIYNYFHDRDALVTALIVDAYTSFGEAQEQSIVDIPAAEHALRLRTLGQAYRLWAVTYPERYQLIFGTPIAGYSAPLETIMPAAARSLANLVHVLNTANSAGRLRRDNVPSLSTAAKAMLKAWQSSRDPDVPQHVLYLALTIWGRVHGLVSLEVGCQYPPFITDAGEFFRLELEHLLQDTLLQQGIQQEPPPDF